MNIDIIEKISSKEDFINFLESLRSDLKANQDKWSNITLEDYLAAAQAFVEDSPEERFSENLSKWQVCATVLYGGKIYE